jgi:hypothetical protein
VAGNPLNGDGIVELFVHKEKLGGDVLRPVRYSVNFSISKEIE